MESLIYENFIDTDTSTYIFYSSNNSSRVHFHQRFELNYLVKGSKTAIVNGVTYTIKENQIAFIPRCYLHGYLSDNSCTDIIYIPSLESTSDFSAEFKNFTLPIILDDEEYNKSELLDLFLAIAKKENSVKHLIVKSYTAIILDKMFDHYKKIPIQANRNLDLILDILNYIEANYAEDISLSDIASNFSYSKFYFSKLFNQNVGQSLTSYINNVRIQHLVNKYNANNNQDITKLAFECGFNSLTAFYRCFSEIYKCNPIKYFKSTYITKVISEKQ